MSCPNATAPINIDLANISGKCDLKCDYKFTYTTSSCVATNRGDYISLSYDNQTNSPVLYNATGYNVQEVRLYTPSLHSYSGTKTDAELIAIHNAATGSKPLLVCIPIKSSNSTSVSAKLFQQIVSTMASNAPADGESTEVNCDNYSLNDLVPRKPFFSYTATEPYQPCSTSVDYIVFAPSTANLDINPATLSRLTNIIKKNQYDIKQGAKLFYNEKGPGLGGAGGDDIYIDCQPVGSSQEQDIVVTDNGFTTMYTAEDILNSPYVQLIIAAIVFLLILYVMNVLFKASGSSAKSIIPNVISNGIK
jgi:carbonic anhydrase